MTHLRLALLTAEHELSGFDCGHDQLTSWLIRHALGLRRAVAVSDAAAAHLVVVDAIDERAVSFYRDHGFIDLPENPLRLYRKIADTRRSIDGT